jgi:putative intracellular protease/amidase
MPILTRLALVLVACCGLLAAADQPAAPARKVLMVVTSHAILGKTGYPTGLWLTELAHPYHALTEAGFQVDIASPKGGAAPIDPYSDPNAPVGMTKNDLIAWGFLANPTTKAAIANTTALAKVDPAAYEAVIIAGGNGAIFDLADDKDLQRVVAALWTGNKVVAALCHGTAGLLNVKLADGSNLIAGKRITGFSNVEEGIAQKAIGAEYLPFYIETETPKRGATFACGAPFQSFTVVDGGGRLITGQQNFSGAEVGRLVVAALNKGK